MTSLIQLSRLRRNDVHLETLQLELKASNDSEEVSALVDVLKANTKVKRAQIQFYQHFFDGKIPAHSQDDHGVSSRLGEKETTELLQTIGALPKLQSFSCSGSALGSLHKLPISSMTELLQEGACLEVLDISRIKLTGTSREFCDFQTSIRQHVTLRKFCLDQCQLEIVNESSSQEKSQLKSQPKSPKCWVPKVLDSMLQALAHLPTIETIAITAKKESSGNISSCTLGQLARSDTLKKLILKGFWFHPQHIQEMGPGTAKSTSLQEVILGTCSFPVAQQRNAKLEACLVDMLQENTSLINFELETGTGLIHNDNHHFVGLIHVANQVLQRNTKLQTLKLGFFDTHETLSSSCAWQEQMLANIHFWLKLNQAGRNELLHNNNHHNQNQKHHDHSDRQWVKAMEGVTGDLDCIHYFLSLNPSVYAQAALQ